MALWARDSISLQSHDRKGVGMALGAARLG